MKNEKSHPGRIVPIGELSDDLKLELARIINEDISSEKFSSVAVLLDSCAQIQSQIDQAPYDPVALKKSIKAISNHVTKMKEQLALLDSNDQGLFDQYFFAANDRDQLLINLMQDNGDSGFYYVTKRMAEAARYYVSQFKENSKGRKADYTYTQMLHRLADGFEKVFPERAVSKSPDSIFYQLVAFWLNHMLLKTISDPSRHIDKILKRRRNT